MGYINRFLETYLIDYFKHSPPYNTLLLGGARQCGKSTLLTHLFSPPERLHLNLALRGDLCEAIDKTKNFDDFIFYLKSEVGFPIGETNRILIIDEAQFSKKLGGYIRFFKEQFPNQKVILTGSTLSSLFDHHPKPTGRVIEFTLRPFNFQEFLLALDQKELVDRLTTWSPQKPFSETLHQQTLKFLKTYLTLGGLPEVVLSYKKEEDFLRILSNIFAFYKRDFENKVGEKLTSIFNQCFLRIAAATGSSIKNSSIIKSSSPGYKKVPQVLSLLEEWHQIIKVETETSNLSRTGTITPKRYLFDHGIRYLQNPARFADLDLVDTQNILREEIGGIIENFVLTELISLNEPIPLKSWAKTNQSGLIDFVFCQGTQTFAIEVKASLHFNQKHVSALKIYREYYPKSVGILLNLDYGGIYPITEFGKIINIPVYALFSYLQSSQVSVTTLTNQHTG